MFKKPAKKNTIIKLSRIKLKNKYKIRKTTNDKCLNYNHNTNYKIKRTKS